MKTVQIRVQIRDEADLEVAQNLAFDQTDIQLEAISVSTQEVKGQIDPVSAVLIGAGAGLVAKFVLDWWDKRRGGLIIDMRPNVENEIYRDSDVPFGFIITFPADGGKVTIDTKDTPKDAIHQLIETVINGIYSNASELAKAVKAILPNSSVEEKSGADATDSSE